MSMKRAKKINLISVLPQSHAQATYLGPSVNHKVQLAVSIGIHQYSGPWKFAGYDPLCLGLKAEIPPKVYMPLFQLGIKNITQILLPLKEPYKRVIMPASALNKLYPKHDIKAKHKRALNSLALILNGCDFEYDPVREAKAADLSLQQRTIRSKDTLERIASMLEQEDASTHHMCLHQKCVTEFPMHEMDEYEYIPGTFKNRPGTNVDITDGNRLKQETHASKAFERREALPEFEEIVEALVQRDLACAAATNKARKTRRNKGSQIKGKRKIEEAQTSVLEDLLAKIPKQDSSEAYTQYLRESCDIAEMVLATYDDFFEIDSICNERHVEGVKQYEIQWVPHPICNKDVEPLAKLGYKCTLMPLPPDDMHRSQGFESMATWENSWEPEEMVTETDKGHTQLEEFLQRRQKANATASINKRKDTHLSNHERQGHWPDLSSKHINPLHLDPSLKRLISIDPNNPINPDRDVCESGEFNLQVSHSDEHMAEIYAPNGKFLGNILRSRLAVLQRAFMQAAVTNPGKAEQPTESHFAKAIAQLLVRYKDGHTTGACNTKLKNHWATPNVYMNALLQGLSLETERFASPLNFTPSMKHYFSMYQEDQCFGANHDAFSCIWTGASQCNPEYEHVEMDKSVRWAIISAAHSSMPALTAFVLPWWEDSAYFKWMEHPLVHRITRVKAKHFKFKKTDYSTKGELYAGNPKWDVNIFIVANASGIDEYVKPAQLKEGLRVAAAEFKGPMPTMTALTANTYHEHDPQCLVHTPKALRRVLDDTRGPKQPHPWSNMRNQPFQLVLSTPRPARKWDPDSMWYTDGSAVEDPNRIGAGVYCKDEGIARRVQCNASGPTNTITRAELCALHQCLKEMAVVSDKNETIATDSKAIMQLVDNGIWSSDNITENKHKTLITAIAQQILDRAKLGLHTAIVKVKSHTGIIGNDEADRLARSAADKPNENDAYAGTGGAFDGLFWPMVPAQKQRENKNRQRPDHGQIPLDKEVTPNSCPHNNLWLAANLNTALKNAARHRFQTGLTNKTLYVSIWEGLRDELDLKASNLFWKCKAISAPALKQTLRVRYGVLHHMGQAFKMRRPYLPGLPVARTKACPLCSEDDSATHILNACKHPEMKAMHIERHNAAARLILKEILRGAKGNHYVVADIGSSEKMRGLGAFDNRVNRIVSEQDMETLGYEPSIRDKLRPDILLIGGRQACGKRKRTTRNTTARPIAHIAEIGYTAEGRYRDKELEKQEQHQQLRNILRKLGYKVKVHTIILGSAGGIFKNMDNLAKLGIDKARCDMLKRRLHIHSITWLHNIIKKRRSLEHGKLFRDKRPKKPPDRQYPHFFGKGDGCP